MSEVRLLAFLGSLRRGSLNRRLLDAAGELAPVEALIERFDLASLPPYNGDLDGEIGGGLLPRPVEGLKRAIQETDGLLIVSPEYNWSIPGVLKNAIDWASRPAGRSVLVGKPTALMGASSGPAGTWRAQLHLREVLLSTGTPVLMRSVQVGRAAERFDGAGRLVDEAVRDAVRDVLERLVIAATQRRLGGFAVEEAHRLEGAHR
jgi:chromate reductase